MREGDRIAELKRTRRVVVVPVVSVDDLVAERGDELPDVEPEPAPDRSDGAEEGLLQVEVLSFPAGVAKEPGRGRHPRDRAAGHRVDSEARIAWFGDRFLKDNLGGVHLDAVVVEIEDPVLVRSRGGPVEVVRVAGGEEPVHGDLLVPGLGDRRWGRGRCRRGRRYWCGRLLTMCDRCSGGEREREQQRGDEKGQLSDVDGEEPFHAPKVAACL